MTRRLPSLRSSTLLAGALALFGLAAWPGAGSAQEVALVHEAGDRVRVAGMPVREFASGLRMEMLSGDEGAFPDVCFVALVDSNGMVWEEYVSEPFRSGEGELDNACVPRFPVLPTGSFPEAAMAVPVEEGVGADAFFGGMADWEFIMKRVDQSAPELFEGTFKFRGVTEGLQMSPPPHVEGTEWDWVATVFLVGPSEETMGRMGMGFSTRPIVILVGAR